MGYLVVAVHHVALEVAAVLHLVEGHLAVVAVLVVHQADDPVVVVEVHLLVAQVEAVPRLVVQAAVDRSNMATGIQTSNSGFTVKLAENVEAKNRMTKWSYKENASA